VVFGKKWSGFQLLSFVWRGIKQQQWSVFYPKSSFCRLSSLSLNDARASLRTGCDDTMRPPFVVAPARFGWCKGVVARVFFARVQAFQEEEEGDGGHTRCWGRVIDRRRRRRRRTKKAKNRISFWFFHPKRDLKNRLSKKRFQKKKERKKEKTFFKKENE
jgi:hypothetical protein